MLCSLCLIRTCRYIFKATFSFIHSPTILPPKLPFTNQQGFTYIMAMFFVVMIGISLMMIGQQWSVTMKRDKEAELFFRGNRIKNALDQYAADFEVQKGTRTLRYPRTLKELTKKTPKRYLQAVYKDPMTGKDFLLIKEGQEIKGVRSSSKEIPYDQVNFKGAGTYDAIRFEATPPSTNCTPNPLNPLLPTNCQKKGATSKKKSVPSPTKHPPSQTGAEGEE